MKPKVTTLSRALALSIAITGLAPSIAAAQAVAPGGTSASLTPVAIPSFARAIEGKDVWISAEGARVRGRVMALNPTSLVLVEDGVETRIDYTSIVRVEKSTRRIRNGALIGLAFGVGLSVATAVSICGDSPCYGEEFATLTMLTGLYAGLGAAGGAGIGAIINASSKGSDVLYDKRRSTTTVSFAPILSKTRKGAALSISWR